MWGDRRKNRKDVFRPKTRSELKDRTRIVFIDDHEIDVVEAVRTEGWRVSFLKDVAKLDQTELIDAHIACIDIIGVGRLMKFEKEGLGLARAIHEVYPHKKILLYSSTREHDMFDDALDMVDRRVFKDGQPYAFIKAIEDLAAELFDWNTMVAHIYSQFSGEFRSELSEEQLANKLMKSIDRNGSVDRQKIINTTGVTINVAGSIASILQAFL